MRLPLLLLFLAACSGGAPTLYGQGIPMAPSAPAFSPTLDAPITVGQPGYIGSPENLPRGESKRVLPPTREPGIWASSPSEPSTGPRMFGIPLALPDNERLEHAYVAHQCTQMYYLIGGQFLPGIAQVDLGRRACMAARLYAHCAKGLFDEQERRRLMGESYNADNLKIFREVAAAAAAQEAMACKVALTDTETKVVDELKRRWTTTARGPMQ